MSIVVANNLAEAFHRRVELNPARVALLRKQVDSWVSMSWREFEEKVFDIAQVLEAEGLKKGDRVALVAHNQPHWAMCDLAILSLGAVTVPVYPTLMADDIFYILEDSESKILICDNETQMLKISSIRKKMTTLKKVFCLKNINSDEADFLDARVIELRSKITSLTDAFNVWRAKAQEITREDTASIVYTSGTTGEPKGVILTHGNFISVAEQALSLIEIGEDDVSLFFLPPAHVLGRIEQFLSLMAGWTTSYCEDLSRFVDNLSEVKPSFFIGVPRIFEKIFEIISMRFQTGLPFGNVVFSQAMRVAFEYSLQLERGLAPGFLLKKQYDFFNQILYSKVQKRFGPRFRFAIVGGAMMSEDLLRFFHTCGVLVLEGYGLTETTGPISMNTPRHFKMGSVGRLFFHNRAQINDDGEILLKGPGVFKEYLHKKDLTSESFKENFFTSGDIGEIDSEGYLFIKDRKKDIIVTSGGKKVAPQKIESIITEDPLFSQALVFGGEGRSLGVLLSVNSVEARKYYREQNQKGMSFDDWYRGLPFKNLIDKHLEARLSRLASFERPKKWRLLPRDLSVEAGELTPSLKIRRKFCVQKFAPLIEEIS
jgi:long-chain acyl-CoA synthetase